MKLGRIYQPRNPAFWLLLVFNLLSTLLAWVARTHDLAAPVAMVLVVVAVANALFGLRLLLLLMRDPPAAKPD
jgi:hypothetical protein